MTASRVPEPAPDCPEPLCPPWCDHEHLGQPGDPAGFHHDGVVTAVDLEGPESAGCGSKQLFVLVSQREHEGELEQPYVEVQDAHRTVALMTSAQCMRLAQALLEGAQHLPCEDDC